MNLLGTANVGESEVEKNERQETMVQQLCAMAALPLLEVTTRALFDIYDKGQYSIDKNLQSHRR